MKKKTVNAVFRRPVSGGNTFCFVHLQPMMMVAMLEVSFEEET
jgi:hypothetical protein